MKTYFIKEGYTIRPNNMFYNDTNMKDEWQKEVYQYARQQFDIHNLTSVWDIGTGSGYYFFNCQANRLFAINKGQRGAHESLIGIP